ncbi:MAG: helix-turn-helix transcriptional regulator [Treponema sp.]|nr:helix-turn-helix transcriptional regulator [Treponema sp.]
MAKKTEINKEYIHRLISNNIKRLRGLQNVSQLNLAAKTGLTHNFINDIENCKKGVSTATLAKMSAALNVEPFQFFLPEGSSNSEAMVYIRDISDSFHKVVNELAQQYLTGDKGKK